MSDRGLLIVGLDAVLAFEKTAYAGHDHEKDEVVDHTLIVGVGGAADVGDGSLHAGANLMVEWDAIESWLESRPVPPCWPPMAASRSPSISLSRSRFGSRGGSSS